MTAIPQLRINHIGIYVSDLDRMVDFYTKVMGFMVTDRGSIPNGTEMAFMSRHPKQHHQVVLASGRPEGLPSQINQLSFEVDTLDDLRTLYGMLAERDDIDGLVQTTHGVSWSVYFNDPEGNRTEFFVETPWYTPAPRGMALDLSKSDDEILRETEAALSEHPQFRTRADWREDAGRKMKETGAWQDK